MNRNWWDRGKWVDPNNETYIQHACALGCRKALGRPAIFHLLWIKGLENGRLIASISDSEGFFSQDGTFSYCASLKGICT